MSDSLNSPPVVAGIARRLGMRRSWKCGCDMFVAERGKLPCGGQICKQGDRDWVIVRDG